MPRSKVQRSSSDVDDTNEDSGFSALPLTVRQHIDRAFDAALISSVGQYDEFQPGPSRKRRKIDNNSTPDGGFIAAEPGGFVPDDKQPGGFIVDEPAPGGFMVDDGPQAGGFIVEDEEDDVSQSDHTQIPLSLIPTALQLLDLQPDDEDVLSVFRTAASGWGQGSRSKFGQDDEQEQHVSRKDWRAVCAALLDAGAQSADVSGDAADEGGADSRTRDDMNEDDSGSEDEYMDDDNEESESADDAEDSDDEYREGGFIAPKSKGKSKAAARQPKETAARRASKVSSLVASEEEDDDRPRRLTARQETECRRVFGLFFPDTPDGDLDEQRIMIKDITRVAKLLKEKIKTEEIVEMLEAFSSSPDKSMSLRDFEQMMIAAKLA
ncbi:hypothetical protein AcV7_007297 [Taiwanofungus camphoratus]|nr:hypothetical protein AcW2_005533 [Antrodia cinnamomea]KAI0953897.1 hypothetical protein AcV7_007297 [Antrodia cinnamomea]